MTHQAAPPENARHPNSSIAPSGSGKSTAIQRLLRKHPDAEFLSPDRLEADVASFLIPSPATLKSVGLACLSGLGYPLRRERTAMMIWDLVQTHLRSRRVLFLHLDEVQDLHVNRAASERQAVVNTLKSVMQNATWPVGLILSGTTPLKDLVNLDPQLSRRLLPIELAPISAVAHGREIATVLARYAARSELPLASNLAENSDFISRLIHAGADELGLVIETVVAGIEEALLSRATELDADVFRRAFERRAGVPDALNPFVADDWQAIDARLLMQAGDEFAPASGPQTRVR
ncbi:TniB family NTP-binding protein [Roseinatronobacter monicus]|uniref:TniB protein n=1 Tax=Roseinatronobacter monicus TaxID=393481 RepID=A0A543KG67_9RHOB|nr:TniB family NTP-binding protein [Roseinatronobacter monicus]TQM94060.1 TniB protein [Roseinatronobacter monicus]